MVKYMMDKHGRNGFLESSVTGLKLWKFFIELSGGFVVFSILKVFIFMLRKCWRQQRGLIRIPVV
jgi:hypothetical protein